MRQLVAAGLVRKVETYPAVEASQLGYGLPAGWSAAPLGNVALVLDHLREPVKADEREARCAGKQADDLYPYFGATQQQGWIDDYRLDGEFVLLGEDGVPFLDPLRHKAYLVSGRVWVNNHAHVLLGVTFSNAFLLHYLNQFDYTGRVTGTTRAKLTKGDLVDIPIPVPPLAEQHRIVARVEELMGLLDRLEAARAKRETTRAAARDSVLAALRQADSPAEVDAAWTRFAQRMDDLVCDPADIAPLRLSVLQLAVRGRLVRRDTRDGSGLEAVRCARMESARVVTSAGPASEAARLAVPEHWTCAQIGTVADLRLGKMLDNAKNAGRPQPYLRNTNVHWFRFELDSIKTMLVDDTELAELLLKSGDVLICEGGHGIARTAVWRGELDNVVFQKALHRVRPLPCVNSDFLSYCLRVQEATGELQRFYTGAGIPHFTGRALARVVIPIPPPKEQERIVVRVNELMGLLDRLEARLRGARTAHSAFAAAAVHHFDS